MTLLLNRELGSRVKLCLISVIPDIVKGCDKIRNLPKIFLRSFENVSPGTYSISAGVSGQTTAVYYSTNHKIPANSLTRIRPH